MCYPHHSFGSTASLLRVLLLITEPCSPPVFQLRTQPWNELSPLNPPLLLLFPSLQPQLSEPQRKSHGMNHLSP